MPIPYINCLIRLNDRIAQVVNDVTGNMWFFWASLLFILILRLSHPTLLNEFLLDVENDLQLLLLAVNAEVGAKQLKLLIKMLEHIKEEKRFREKIYEK